MASRRKRTSRLRAWTLAPLATSFAAVVLVLLVLRWLEGGGDAAWAVLPGLIGATTFVAGVAGLVRMAWSTPGGDLAAASVHVALVLAGGLLLGGGWAAALGLALLGSTALIHAHRR